MDENNTTKTKPRPIRPRKVARVSGPPRDYSGVLAETTRLINEARQRALATVNHELVSLYWHIGRTIVRQQESADWGGAVVRQFAQDLRTAFPDMKGLTQDNLWRMRQFFLAIQQIDQWLQSNPTKKLGTASRETDPEILGTLSRDFCTPETQDLILGLSWSHHTSILGRCEDPEARCFYISNACPN